MIDQLKTFSEARDEQEVADLLVQIGARYGVVYASHRILRADGTSSGVTTMPASWIEHYRISDYDKLDPGAALAAKERGVGGNSFEEPASGEEWSRKEQQMNWEIRSLGATGSFFLSQTTPQPGTISMVNFITDAAGAHYGRWIVANGGQLRILAASAHVRFMELSGMALAGDTLTNRERDVLRWLAEGYRVDRIAEKMGLSNRTVEVHLARARKRLGAKTREQALVLALRNGLFGGHN